MHESVLIAATPMLGNLITALVMLVMGVVLFRGMRGSAKAKGGVNWTPIVAFLCGPALATVYFVCDVLWIGHGTYTLASDYFDMYWRVLVIGLVAGTLGAMAFWVEQKIR